MAKKRRPTTSAPARPLDLDNPAVRGTVFEWLGIEDWIPELNRRGYAEFYSRRNRQRRLPHGARDFPEWARRAFPIGGPDFIAIDGVNRKILVGDITANPASPSAIKPGDLRKLPHGIGSEIENRHHLGKTVDNAEQLARHLPEELQDCEVVAQDRYRESNLKVSREVPVYRNRRFLRPSAASRAASHIDDAARGVDDASRLVGSKALPQARVVGGINKPLMAGFKARSLAVGVKAWKAFRTVGKMFVFCFLPLKALDVVLDVAFALWDREREKEERKRQEKQKALEAVFKQEENIPLPQLRYEKSEPEVRSKVQSLIQSKILNNTPLFEEFVRAWDNNKKYPGFLYARLIAELHIETFRDHMGHTIEALTTYTVASLDVFPTEWAHDFELTEIGDEKEPKKTESDIKRLRGQGVLGPESVRKLVKRKRVKYTIVPPLFTPFDIVVTKINNLFSDIVLFVDAYGGMGEGNFTGFNYKGSYDEQFSVAIAFPHPLNESTCRYCLSYLHWAAGILSQHPLTEQDLAGNLEDPRKGRQRRFWLLMKLLEKLYAPQGKNFSVLAGRVKELVKTGGKSEEVNSALDELSIGARAIWYDLERIEANIHKPQYYYFGPNYKEPA